MRIGLTTAIATAIAIGVVVAGGGGGPAAATANLWVIASNSPNGSCTRNATAETLAAAETAGRQCNPNDDTTNGVLNAAYIAAANSGDTVCVDTGSYGAQQVQYVAANTTPNTVIQGCGGRPTVLGIVVGQGNGSTQTCCVTFKTMDITGSSSADAIFIYYGSNGASKLADRADHITFDDINLCMGQPTNGPCFEAFSTDTVTIKNSTIGPACCGNNGGGSPNGSPVGIRFGADTASSFPVNTDLVIQNNTIRGITHDCTHWLTGFGSCPQSTCTDTGICHEDAIQIWGADNMLIDSNKIYHNETTAIFLDSTALMTNGTIKNNLIGDVINGGTCFDIDGRGIRGTWNAINNTCSIAGDDSYFISWAKDDPDGAGPGQSMEQAGAVWNWKGNAGAILIEPATTPSGGCTGGTTGVFTYSYNTMDTSGSNPGVSGCGGNETVGTPGFANTALAPANTMDLHLAGADSFADNKIPPATCSGFVTVDIDGQTRPIGANCDAGADER